MNFDRTYSVVVSIVFAVLYHSVTSQFISKLQRVSSPSFPLYQEASYEETKEPYNSVYSVKDEYYGVDFGAKESYDGNIVNGHYSVLLPDGRIQNVEYVADPYYGYMADVSYDLNKISKDEHVPYMSYSYPTEPIYEPVDQNYLGEQEEKPIRKRESVNVPHTIKKTKYKTTTSKSVISRKSTISEHIITV